MHSLSLHLENILYAMQKKQERRKEKEKEGGEEEEKNWHIFTKVSDLFTKDVFLALRSSFVTDLQYSQYPTTVQIIISPQWHSLSKWFPDISEL